MEPDRSWMEPDCVLFGDAVATARTTAPDQEPSRAKRAETKNQQSYRLLAAACGNTLLRPCYIGQLWRPPFHGV